MNEKKLCYFMLHLALEKCKELGLENIMISCKEENVGSSKAIENSFGVLIELIYIESEDTYFKKYWINIEKSLSSFKMSKEKKRSSVNFHFQVLQEKVLKIYRIALY